LLSEIAQLYRQRGTLPGLTRLLSILARAPVQIIEGFRLRSRTAAFLGTATLGPALELGGGEGPYGLQSAESWEQEWRTAHRDLLYFRNKLDEEKRCPATDPEDPLENDALIAFYRRHAHRFTVLVQRARDENLEAILSQAIEANKPAHTIHRLCWVDGGYRLGYTSMVGIHALGKTARAAPAVLGEAVLGGLSTVNRAAASSRRSEQHSAFFQPTSSQGQKP
jgi:hypothetical protein